MLRSFAVVFGLLSATHALAVRPTLTGTELTHPSSDGHVLIHYTWGGLDALPDTQDTQPQNGIPDAIDDVETGMHRVWEEFVQADGWPAPRVDQGEGGDDRLDVYLRVIDANGYAHYEPLPGSGTTCYMELAHDGRNLGPLTFQSVAGHELHHCLQAAQTTRVDSWIFEATSTWVQYSLFTGAVVVDVARQVLWQTRLSSPQLALDATGNRYEYAGMVWIQFLLDRGRVPRTQLLGLWQDMAAAGDWEQGHQTAMARFNLPSLEDAVAEFAEWNLFACLQDDGFHYAPNGLPCEFDTGVPTQRLYELPADVVTVSAAHLGAVYVELEPNCASQDAVVTVTGSGPFVARAVEVRANGGALAYTRFSEGDAATLELPGWNDHRRTVVAIVNRSAVPQTFQVSAQEMGTYVPQPSVDGALSLLAGAPRTTLRTGEQVTLTLTGRFNACPDDADIASRADWVSTNPGVATVQGGVVREPRNW